MKGLIAELKLLGVPIKDGCILKRDLVRVLSRWDSVAFSKRELEDLFESFTLFLANTEGDFYEVSEKFEKEAKEDRLTVKVHKLLSEIFESLDDPKGMSPDYEELKILLERVPKTILDRQLTDDVVLRHVPESDWDQYRDRDWIKKAA